MPRRLRLLHAIHDFLPRHQAGSEIYAAALCQELLRRGHHVTVLAASFDTSRRHGEVIWRVHEGLPVVEVVNNWAFDSFEETYRASNLQTVLDHVLRATQPEVLHVHNLLNLSIELPRLARARGARVVGTLHDYTLVCPSGGQRIHRAERHVCHTIEPDRCARCFAQSPYPGQMAFGRTLERPGGSIAHVVARTLRRYAPRLLARLAAAPGLTTQALGPTACQIAGRLEAARSVAAQFDLLVGPSPSIVSEFRALGVGPQHVEVADYGFRQIPPGPQSASVGPLRVGFVGTLVWHKGVHVLIDAVRQIPPDRVQLSIYGDIDTFPDYTAELRGSARGLPVQFMGRFERDRTAGIYSQFDVLVVPSLWLENSPLVIHEAFMAHVPVIGARIGGISDLVRDGENGLLYSPNSSSELAAVLNRLATDRDRLHALRKRPTAVRTIEDDAADWERRYLSVVTDAPNRRAS